MKTTVKTLLLMGSGLVLLSFGVIVINQTAQVVELTRQVHPTLGTVTLWGLLVTYTGLIGVPVVMVIRMPRALTPPSTDAGPEFQAHLSALGRRLESNPRVPVPIGSRPVRSDSAPRFARWPICTPTWRPRRSWPANSMTSSCTR